MSVKIIARPRGKALVDVAFRTGTHPEAMSLAGNACISVADWETLRRILKRGADEALREAVLIEEPKDGE